jgi:CRISPR-associated protein Csd2
MKHCDPTLRHDAVLLFDVLDGNPNGDPDANGAPRTDPETMHGLVSDVSIKRKVRDYVLRRHRNGADDPAAKIYMEAGVALNEQHRRAYTALGMEPTGSKQAAAEVAQAEVWMKENFYDIRLFGAVMSTSVNSGRVRGPLQVTFARSVDPVFVMEATITRVAVTRAEDMDTRTDEQGRTRGGKRTEMGSRLMIPYGLYRAHVFYTPTEGSGVTEADLALAWEALERTWELDRAAARGMMACQGLYIFTHDNPLGNAKAHRLFGRIAVSRATAPTMPPRAFSDYQVTVNDTELPTGITLTRLGE